MRNRTVSNGNQPRFLAVAGASIAGTVVTKSVPDNVAKRHPGLSLEFTGTLRNCTLGANRGRSLSRLITRWLLDIRGTRSGDEMCNSMHIMSKRDWFEGRSCRLQLLARDPFV